MDFVSTGINTLLLYVTVCEKVVPRLSWLRPCPQLFLKCRLPNRISFDVFDQCSCKVGRGHVKRYAVALSVQGASRSRLCPGPRVHLIQPWVREYLQ